MGGRQPYARRLSAPSDIHVPVNDPPFQHGGPYKLPVFIVGLTQPDPWIYAMSGSRQAYMARQISPGVPGQSTNNPPFTKSGPLSIKLQQAAFSDANWNGSAWPYLFIGYRQPYAPRFLSPSAGAAVTVNNPAFGHRSRTAAMQAIYRSWDPPPYNFEMRMYASGKFSTRSKPSARGYIVL